MSVFKVCRNRPFDDVLGLSTALSSLHALPKRDAKVRIPSNSLPRRPVFRQPSEVSIRVSSESRRPQPLRAAVQRKTTCLCHGKPPDSFRTVPALGPDSCLSQTVGSGSSLSLQDTRVTPDVDSRNRIRMLHNRSSTYGSSNEPQSE